MIILQILGISFWIKLFKDIFKDIFYEKPLISKEGYDILNDPIKRIKLREIIEKYHETGIWDLELIKKLDI